MTDTDTVCCQCRNKIPKTEKNLNGAFPPGKPMCLACRKLDMLNVIGTVGCRTCGVLLGEDGKELNDEQRGRFLFDYYVARRYGPQV